MQPTPADYDPRIERCPLCDGGPLRPYDGDFRGHVIDRCGGCGIKLMNPQYSDDWLQRFYAEYIDEDRGGAGYKCRPEVRNATKSGSLELIAEHLPAAARAAARVLMVGCGDGYEIGLAKAMGWRPEGYDIDPATTERVAARYAVPVHCGDFTGLALEDGRFDAVYMDQVIEHLKNPGAYLRQVRRLLRDGGVLFLGQPNIGSLANRLKTVTSRLRLRRGKRGNHYASKHHIVYFTPGVMRRALRLHGFEVLCVRSSLKPQRNPVTALLGPWLTFLDSGFIALARKPAAGDQRRRA